MPWAPGSFSKAGPKKVHPVAPVWRLCTAQTTADAIKHKQCAIGTCGHLAGRPPRFSGCPVSQAHAPVFGGWLFLFIFITQKNIFFVK
jgi:hypothetical protein